MRLVGSNRVVICHIHKALRIQLLLLVPSLILRFSLILSIIRRVLYILLSWRDCASTNRKSITDGSSSIQRSISSTFTSEYLLLTILAHLLTGKNPYRSLRLIGQGTRRRSAVIIRWSFGYFDALINRKQFIIDTKSILVSAILITDLSTQFKRLLVEMISSPLSWSLLLTLDPSNLFILTRKDFSVWLKLLTDGRSKILSHFISS